MFGAALVFFIFLSKNSSRRLEQHVSEGLEKKIEQQRDESDRLYQYISKSMSEIGGRNNDNFQKLRSEFDEKFNRLDTKMMHSQESIQKGLQSGLTNFNETTGKIGEKFAHMTKFDENSKQIMDTMLNLNKTLSNVKSRGMFGEYQLELLISETFPEGSYDKQVSVKTNSQERVDFVVKIPQGPNKFTMLPIDSKFPLTSYERLLKSRENSDEAEEEEALKDLLSSVKNSAKEIQKKYINPPRTTDFAILFLPQESIFLEIAKRSSAMDELRKKYNVIVIGPSIFHVLLSTLVLGFRNVAMAEKSREILGLFDEAYTEIKRFSSAVEDAVRRNEMAGTALEKLQKRSSLIERRFEKLPKSSAKEFPEQNHIAASEEEFSLPAATSHVAKIKDEAFSNKEDTTLFTAE